MQIIDKLNQALYILLLLLFSCNQKTQDEKILETTSEVLTIIKDNSETKFTSLIAIDLDAMGKDEELIHYDFNKLHGFYNKYVGDKQIKPVIIDTLNELGQKRVMLVFHKGTPDSEPPYDIRLDLYFGPPNLFSLDKISGYKIVEKLDALHGE